MRTLAAALSVLLALLVPAGGWAEKAAYMVQSDPQLEFAREICLEALKRAGVGAEFTPFPPAPEMRLTAELAKGNLHLAFLPPNEDRAGLETGRSIAAIRIPLERGLLGYRICILREADKDMLKDVASAQGLRRFTIGQGYGWSDIEVYRLAGIPVAEAPFLSPSAPLRALAAGHYDLLPLGLGEYEAFQGRFNPDGYPVAVDQHIVIRYPWFRYVWVSMTAPGGDALLEHLRKGLDMMAADGSFLRVYEKHRGRPDLGELKGRRIIVLPSPYGGAWDIEPQYRGLLVEPR